MMCYLRLHHFDVVLAPAEHYGLSSSAPVLANLKKRTGFRIADATQPDSPTRIHHSILGDLLKPTAKAG